MFSWDLCNGGQSLPPPPPGYYKVKLSLNLGAAAVEPVAPVDTSLRAQSHSTKMGVGRAFERNGYSRTEKVTVNKAFFLFQL